MFKQHFDLERFKEKVIDAFVACYDERPVICGKRPGTFRVELLRLSLDLVKSRISKDFSNVNIRLNKKLDNKTILKMKSPEAVEFLLQFNELIAEQEKKLRSDRIRRGIQSTKERRANNEQNFRSSNNTNKSQRRPDSFC